MNAKIVIEQSTVFTIIIGENSWKKYSDFYPPCRITLYIYLSITIIIATICLVSIIRCTLFFLQWPCVVGIIICISQLLNIKAKMIKPIQGQYLVRKEARIGTHTYYCIIPCSELFPCYISTLNGYSSCCQQSLTLFHTMFMY